jgi:type IV secretion system protein VirB10
MTAESADDATPQPEVSIRARPPSPKRLSRRVLMAGAVCVGGIVAISLMVGLGVQRRHPAVDPQATVAASGPPETIQHASNQYEVTDLPRARRLEDPTLVAAPAAVEPELAPPQEAAWAQRGAPVGAVAERASPPDPRQAARTSPILFNQPSGGQSSERPTQTGVNADRLDARLTPPRSRYELLAGSVIPAALVTELNSDLPGRIIAQVTAPVYDSVGGAHLLIPQGARLMGTYSNAVSYGDRRIVLVWNRLILPNGWSISLQSMDGTDPSGAAGVRDRTDNHLGRLSGAIGLSAIISVIANNAEDEHSERLTQSIGDAAAQEAARTGGRIVDRELSVHPTLRVRAGAAVRVLVTRDIQLRPYREDVAQ